MVNIEWNLFKPSGKWAYGGVAEISGNYRVFEAEQLLQEIDDNQTEVVKGTITSREYILVIIETKEQMADSNYHGFYHALYPNTVEWE